jgi:hypothetical protein
MLLYHFRSVAIEYLQKEYSEEFSGEVSAHEILVCFAFYCSNEPASVCDILAALVRQALERADHVLPAIKDLYLQLYTRHRLEGTRPSEDELVELLLEVSKHFAFRSAFLMAWMKLWMRPSTVSSGFCPPSRCTYSSYRERCRIWRRLYPPLTVLKSLRMTTILNYSSRTRLRTILCSEHCWNGRGR